MKIVLFVNNLKDQTSFYSQILNAMVDSDSEGIAVISTTDFELTLHQIPAEYQEQLQSPPQIREDCAWKPSFEVSDLRQVRSTATALGGELKDPSFEWAFNGFNYCDGNDPEGNVIQFRQKVALEDF